MTRQAMSTTSIESLRNSLFTCVLNIANLLIDFYSGLPTSLFTCVLNITNLPVVMIVDHYLATCEDTEKPACLPVFSRQQANGIGLPKLE